MPRSKEPLVWAPFAAGMMADAMVMPALIVITGFLVPAGTVQDGVRNLFVNPIIRVLLFVLISLTFFHAAHRLKFTLVDLGFKNAKTALNVLCYGGAILGTLIAGAVAVNLL